MNILEIYKRFHNMPQQAEHQLKVAAVVAIILDHLSLILDRETVIKACLLHDLGNLVKFDFNYTKKFMPELVEPEALSYWEDLQKQYISKYGSDSHQATMKMIGELGIDGRIKELVDCIGFNQGADNAATEDLGKKICAYSDMRVEPEGVVSLEERFKGLRHRYQNHKEGEKDRERFESALRQIERQIFAHCNIKPQDITEQAIAPLMTKLKNWEI